MPILSHLTSFLGDVKSLDDRDSSDSAICISAWALSKSMIMYKMAVGREFAAGLGRRANRGNRRGACQCININDARLGKGSNLVVDSAIVGRDIASVEKNTLLYYGPRSVSIRAKHCTLYARTPLEARNGR